MGRRKKNPEAESTNERFSREEKDNKVFTKKILTGKEVQERLERSVTLLSITEKGLHQLVDYFIKFNQIIFIADGEGCLVHVSGSEPILVKLNASFIIAGTYPDEDSILAKAIGGAIIENKITRIDGKSLTQPANEQWSAVGLPIYDSNANAIGAIVFVMPMASVCDHTMLLIDVIADLINQNLAFDKKEVDYNTTREYHNALFNQHPFFFRSN